MANIKKIEGKTGVSYKITVTMGRTKTGKQIRHYQTFTPPPGMRSAKRRKKPKSWRSSSRKSCAWASSRIIRLRLRNTRRTFWRSGVKTGSSDRLVHGMRAAGANQCCHWRHEVGRSSAAASQSVLSKPTGKRCHPKTGDRTSKTAISADSAAGQDQPGKAVTAVGRSFIDHTQSKKRRDNSVGKDTAFGKCAAMSGRRIV